MKTVCIKFELPQRGFQSKDEPSFIRSLKHATTTFLSQVFPVANPDFENRIKDVRYWLVECDKESGIPQREIGIDENEQVILKMPFNDNYGYWTDNNLLLEDFILRFNASRITSNEFEQHWSMFQ
jgi:hypothetical protein